MGNPLKSYDFSGFPGPSDWFRTSGLVVPNRNRKLFSDAQDILMGAPSEVTQKQLDELHIAVTAHEE